MSKNAKVYIWTQNWTLGKANSLQCPKIGVFGQKWIFGTVWVKLCQSHDYLCFIFYEQDVILSPLVRNAALWAHKKQRKLYCFKVFSTSCCTPNSFQRLKICKVLQNSLVHFICCLARFVKFVMYQRLWSWMSKVSRASCWNHNEHHPDHFFISQRAGKNVVHEKLCVTKSYQSLVLW